MCRRALLGLEPTPQAAGAARHFVAEVSRRWGIDDVIDQVTLAVSELVTNAVLHARTNIDVELCVIGAAMTVGVIDRDPRPPVIRPVRLDLLADLDAVPSVTPDFDDRLQINRHPDRHPTELHPTDRPPTDPQPTELQPTADVGSSGSIAAGRGLLIVDQLGDKWGVAERTDGKEVWLTVPVRWAHVHECVCNLQRFALPGHGCIHIAGSWDTPAVDHA